MARAPLDVWLYGIHVATLSEVSRNRIRLEFTEDAETRFGLGSSVLSAAMPIDTTRRPNGLAVRAFFTGLLPEGDARAEIERIFEVRRGDDFGLLEAIGRDCAGAAVIVPFGFRPDPRLGRVEMLSDGELEREIRELPGRPFGADDKVRVSLAGVQPKLLLAKTNDGTWGRPIDGYPSTHILKPQNMQLPHYAVAETFCLRLARSLGLTTVDVDVVVVDTVPVVVVSRYDRLITDGAIERVHQEDAAQALSVDTLSGGSKYEADGGRKLSDLARLLAQAAGQADLRQLLRATVLNVLVGNADAHTKNISLLHLRDGSIHLAPLYDVTPTTFYRQVPTSRGPKDMSDELGMFVNDQRSIHQVTAGDLIAEGTSWGLLARDAEAVVMELLHAAGEHLDEAAERSEVPEQLRHFVAARRSTLEDGRRAGDGEFSTSRSLDNGAH